jgi:Mg-chelatase subunit ChlD
MSSKQIPDSFICPITNAIMRNPVIDPDGNSYEKDAILEWVLARHSSPITRNMLLPSQLFPNRALREMIEQFIYENPDVVEDTAQAKRDVAQYMAEKDNKVDYGDLVADSKVGDTGRADDKTSDSKTAESKDDVIGLVENEDKDEQRKPLLLVPIIDVSGSMQESCGGSGQMENDGYSRLDLVKHTLNTLITSLSSEDYCCIVKFSTVADVFVPPTKLTPANKKNLIEKLKGLEPENQTNLWDGVRLAIDTIANLGSTVERFNIQMYVLTDGEPNINPPGSISETTRQHILRRLPHIAPVINTFGYGYNLDSDLLFHLSRVVPGGIFGFIPDATMVGTVFINALSHSLLHETPQIERLMVDVSKEFVVTLFDIISARDPNNREMLLNRFVDYLKNCVRTALRENAEEITFHFLEELRVDCSDSTDPNRGQIFKAIKEIYFNHWGKHYLRSIISSYQNMVCINFKDLAMQRFRSERFIQQQKRIENIFIQLPPPRPSNQIRYSYYGGGYQANTTTTTAHAAPVSMANYINAAGGCFTGDSLVMLIENDNDNDQQPQRTRSIPVKDLLQGQEVLSLNGKTKIEAIIQIKYSGPIYAIHSMFLTAYHPILLANGEEYFPCEYHAATPSANNYDGYVYDVILENRSLLAAPIPTNLNNMNNNDDEVFYVATFGHQRKSKIFSHDYFGSEKIVDDLKATEQWKLNHQNNHDHDKKKKMVIRMEKPVYVRNEEGMIHRVIWE